MRAEKAIEPQTSERAFPRGNEAGLGSGGDVGACQGVIVMLPGSPSVTSPTTAA